ALVDAALANQSQAHAVVDSRRLLLGFAIADQFIDVLSRVEAVRAARATVERARIFADIVKVLVDKELRPGVEHSRAAAELALANTRLIRAEQAEAVSRAELARTLGAAGEKIETAPGKLAAPPPSTSAASSLAKNPLLVEAAAAVTAAQARKHAVDLQY